MLVGTGVLVAPFPPAGCHVIFGNQEGEGAGLSLIASERRLWERQKNPKVLLKMRLEKV